MVRIATDCGPDRQTVQTRWSWSSTAYGSWPRFHCGKRELGVLGVQRDEVVAVPPVEVPPAGAVREQDQLVAEPARLHRRLPGPAGHAPHVGDGGRPESDPTITWLESHGMSGWFHWVQASRPASDSSGVV